MRFIRGGGSFAPETSSDIYMHVTSSITVISSLLIVYKNFMRYYAVLNLDGLVVETEWAASNMTYSVTST